MTWEAATAVLVRDRGKTEGEELAFLRCLKCAPFLDERFEALSSVCLQWATTSSAEKEHDVEKEGGNGEAVAPVKWFDDAPV